ncbi:RNA polymerase sigma-70 factor (ECF subfamily) [Arcticibacter tournemirensis]|nr:RNA polymerase sigma-70 factor (ECF subfamily) [Arcticibacter tournemirensis]
MLKHIFTADLDIISVEITSSTVIELLKEGNESAFEQVFKEYYKRLHAYAFTFLKDEVAAEEIVQNVFCRIWEKKDLLDVNGTLKSYLYRAVHNESLNYLKHHKVKAEYEQYYTQRMKGEYDHSEKNALVSELEKQIAKALSELPTQCRIIFQLSRFEQLKYQQIADHLGISIKTVENQMGKALKLLRLKLVEFLPVLLLLLLNF